jgi:hypothetical protein
VAKEIVVISPTSTIRKTASILSKRFMLCQYAKVNFWSGVTTTDVIKYFFEQYDGVK